MKTGTIVVLAVLSAALGLAIGATFLGSSDTAQLPAGELEQENRELRRELEQLEARRTTEAREAETEEAAARRAEEELAAAREDLEELRTEEATAPVADAAEVLVEKPDGPRFFADEYGGALGKVDWSMVGTNLSEMVALIPRIATDLAAGKGPRPEDLGRIQQLNGPLMTAALKIQDDLPGSFTNGKFSDPGFMVNAMASTLAMAEQPLSSSQANALESTARAWMARDRQRREVYDDRTWTMRKLYEEAELKDGFFAEAFGLLTTTQAETLSPAHVRGRVRLDLFSSSLLFTALSRPDFFATREALVDNTVRGASLSLRLTDDERVRARPVIATWVERLPRVLVEHETDALDQHGLIPVSLVIAAARQQERLVKELVQALDFDEERTKGARQYPVVHVPLPRYVPEGE